MTGHEYVEALRTQAEAQRRENLRPLEQALEGFSLPDDLQKLVNKIRHTVEKTLGEASAEILRTYYGADVVERVNLDVSAPPFWTERVSVLFGRIKKFIDIQGLEMAPIPLLATLPIGFLDARTIAVRETNEHVIVFNDGLFTFLNLFIKAVISALLPSEGDSSLGEAAARFHEVLLAYVLYGDAGAASIWILDPRGMPFQAILLDASELFILAHEYAHVSTRATSEEQRIEVIKVGDEEAVSLPYTWPEEFAADVVGIMTTLGVMRTLNQVTWVYAGAELFFLALEFVERATNILGGRGDNPMMGLSYPPARDRRLSLRRHIGGGLAPVDASFLFSIAEQIDRLCYGLWENERSCFEELHTNGIRPARRWSVLI